MALKVKGKYSNCTGLKKLNSTDFRENGSKLFVWLRVFRKRIVCTFGNVKLPRYDAIKVNCHIRYRQNVDLWHFDLKTNEGDIRGSANYSFSEFPEVDEQFAAIFRKSEQFYFLPLYNLNTDLWTSTPLNVRTARCIWKIITFLDFLSQGG